MDLGLNDKVALVLASSKGLGKAVALELAREGARVIICGTDAGALKATEAAIGALAPGNVFSVVCDLTDEEQRKRLIDQSVAAFGPIDILVTNTGGPPAGAFEAFSLDDWKHLYNLLFLSAVDVIRLVLPGMKERGFGRILTITSVAVKQPADNLISSNAVRTSLLGLVKSLSNEVAPYGVTVNNLLPGYTSTNRLEDLIAKNPKVNEVKETIPMKRFGTPEEFASAAAFLVSARASYITGQSLAVDGGWIKGH
ncbi:SDR family oxidoreductase [Flaviaesturariibacter amylovorans]|uniref:SDR family oxidoreductase n=1 Tax=Flaviaesturariibacter amylovorans TaxID=1084520 RepID=A0ABP8GFL0_9BACT